MPMPPSHNGNYSVRISNDFGHVSTTSVQLDVNDTQLIHEADLNCQRGPGNDLGATGHFYDGARNWRMAHLNTMSP